MRRNGCALALRLASAPGLTFRSFASPAVLFEDDHLLAINKPAHLPVHGGRNVLQEDTVMGRLNTPPLTSRLHLVHRLDAPTTGVLVLAKSKSVARLLEQAFSSKHVDKTYLAAVVPEFDGVRWRMTGTIDAPIGNKAASTEFKTIGGSHASSCRVVELRPITGRTHQLRIHCASSLAAPILGDSRYGRTRDVVHKELLDKINRSLPGKRPPLFLHCKTLKLPYIRETKGGLSLDRSVFVKIEAPLPDHFLQLLPIID
jgi:23S rRNA-/tRNA-specific pseudouridylate synthase